MAHIPQRWSAVNQWYFVTVVTYKRWPVFADNIACEILLQAFRHVHAVHPFRLAALVILPDHFHGLIRPDYAQGIKIGTVIGAIKRNFNANMMTVGQGYVPAVKTHWQKTFLDHRIRNSQDFSQHGHYIQMNPIKHGLVQTPEQWQWCFFHPKPFG